MHQTIDEEFENEIKQKPCPVCGVIGQITTLHIHFKYNYKGYPVEERDKGWSCIGECGQNSCRTN